MVIGFVKYVSLQVSKIDILVDFLLYNDEFL